MAQPILRIAVEELIERGWQITYADHTGQPAAIRFAVEHWDDLPWAQQTYYRAKYGFTEAGLLEFSLSELGSNSTTSDLIRLPLSSDRDIVSGNNAAGSDDRLRAILGQSRVNVEPSRYDHNALIHTGPDNTAILTSGAGWGPVNVESPSGYAELVDQYTCYWETGSANWALEAPYWATSLSDL